MQKNKLTQPSDNFQDIAPVVPTAPPRGASTTRIGVHSLTAKHFRSWFYVARNAEYRYVDASHVSHPPLMPISAI
jgi:hypothetical protein